MNYFAKEMSKVLVNGGVFDLIFKILVIYLVVHFIW